MLGLGDAAAASLVVKISADIAGLQKGLGDANKAVEQFGGGLSGIGHGMTQLGKTMTAAVSAPVIGMFAAAAKQASDFESAINILSVAARDSGASLGDLRQAALNVGKDTQLVGIDAMEAASAMTNFTKAGLSVADMFGSAGGLNDYLREGTNLQGALRAAVDLSAASELSLAQASDVTAIAMATFGVGAERATAITDSFVRAADASVTSVPELADAMANIGPTWASFYQGMQDPLDALGDMNTALALLSERGIRGAEAGTSLKSMFTNMMRPTDKTVAALQDLNVELYDQEGVLRRLPDILGDFQAGMAGLSEEQRNQYIQTIAGTYGMKAMNTLLAEGVTGWEGMEAAIGSAATAQESATARTQGFAAAWEQFMGTLQTFMIEVGTPLIKDFLTPAVRWLTTFLDKLMENPGFTKWVLGIGAVLAVAGPFLIILGQLITAIGAIGGAIGWIGGLFGGLAGLVSGAIGAIGSLVAGFVALNPAALAIVAALALLWVAWNANFLGIKDIAGEVWGAIQYTFAQIKGIVTTFISFLKGEATWAEVQSVWAGAWSNIADKWGQTWENIKSIFSAKWAELVGNIKAGLVNLVASVLGVEMAEAERIIGQAWENIKTFAGQVWDTIVGVISAKIELLKGVLVGIIQGISGDWAGAWETLKSSVAGYVDDLVGIIDRIAPGFREDFAAGLAAIGAWFEEAKADIAAFGAEVKAGWETITGWVDTVKTKIGEFASTVSEKVEAVKGFFSGLGETVGGVFDTIKTKAGEFVEGLSGFVGDVAETVGGIVGKVWEFITGGGGAKKEGAAAGEESGGGFLAGIWEGIKSGVKTLTESAAEISGMWDTITTKTTESTGTITSAVTTAVAEIVAALLTGWTTAAADATTQWTTLTTTVSTQAETMRVNAETSLSTLQLALQTSNAFMVADTTTQWTLLQTTATTQATTMQANATLAAQTMQASVLAALQTMAAQGIAVVTEMSTGVMGILNSLVGQAHAAGAGMASAFGAGIRSRLDSVYAETQAMVANIRSLLPGSDAETGPLSDLTASGKGLPDTLAKGIERGAPGAIGAAQGLAGDVAGIVGGWAGTTGRGLGTADTARGGVPVYVVNDVLTVRVLSGGTAAAKAVGQETAKAATTAVSNLVRPALGAKPLLPNERTGRVGDALRAGDTSGRRPSLGLQLPTAPAPARPVARPVDPSREGTHPALNITINNPVGEPSESSLRHELRNLAHLGVLKPVGA